MEEEGGERSRNIVNPRKRNRPQPQAEKKAFGKDMRWEGKKEVVTDGEEEKKELGFGDLCRSYHRSLRTERDDYTAHNVSETLAGHNTSTLTPDCNGYD